MEVSEPVRKEREIRLGKEDDKRRKVEGKISPSSERRSEDPVEGTRKAVHGQGETLWCRTGTRVPETSRKGTGVGRVNLRSILVEGASEGTRETCVPRGT